MLIDRIHQLEQAFEAAEAQARVLPVVVKALEVLLNDACAAPLKPDCVVASHMTARAALAAADAAMKERP